MGSDAGIRLWRILTGGFVLVALLTFFMPWVTVSVVMPPVAKAFTGKGELELASQSGFQFTYCGATAHRGIESLAEREMAEQEHKWRMQGKDPTAEMLKENAKYMAPWMAVYPIALIVALFHVRSMPTPTVCRRVGIAVAVVLSVTLLQVTVIGSPLVRAIYDAIAKEGGAEGSLFLSLYLDVKYTTAFTFAMLSLVAAGAVQVLWSLVPLRPVPDDLDW